MSLRAVGLLLAATVCSTFALASSAAAKHLRGEIGPLARVEAPTQTIPAGPPRLFYVVTPGNLTADQLSRAEVAITYQVNVQVRRRWGVPPIRFLPRPAPGATGVWLESAGRVRADCATAEVNGCHTRSGIYMVEQLPSAVMGWFQITTQLLSHEIVEADVDPTVSAALGSVLVEPCDPVDEDSYTVRGITVSDFVFPSWFSRRSGGPWDWLRYTQRPGDLSTGFLP